jgi:hypothetical protein
MGQRGTWNNPGGPTMPPHHLVARARPGRASAWCGAPWPSTYSSTCHSTVSPKKNTTPFLRFVFLLFLLAIFDLLAHPIFAAEIWSICSLVCDSFDCPSRILFSGVFLEYFSTVGNRFSELACLFYCLDKLFWCMFSSLATPYSSFLHLLVSKSFFIRFVKKFRNGRKMNTNSSNMN